MSWRRFVPKVRPAGTRKGSSPIRKGSLERKAVDEAQLARAREKRSRRAAWNQQLIARETS